MNEHQPNDRDPYLFDLSRRRTTRSNVPDVCPFLDYRAEADGRSFDTPRAYCTAAERFVQPMRADICNDRYDLDHRADCEIYQAHADELDENP